MYRIDRCRTYNEVHIPVSCEPDMGCSFELSDCYEGDPMGIQAINLALDDGDVQAALDSGLFFGEDDRPVDGTVLSITVGERSFVVGSPCLRDGCRPVPTGVESLVELLTSLGCGTG
jgi:hypothetical protein